MSKLTPGRLHCPICFEDLEARCKDSTNEDPNPQIDTVLRACNFKITNIQGLQWKVELWCAECKLTFSDVRLN